MVKRIYVEKRKGFDVEASQLKRDLESTLNLKIEDIRVLNRYDVEGLGDEDFARAVKTIFSEPQTDDVFERAEADGCIKFSVEYLPGQFDQRADSAAQCNQIMTLGNRPKVTSAKTYLIKGVSEEELAKIKKYLINPVECREASEELPETLADDFTAPAKVKIVEGLSEADKEGLQHIIDEYGLSMDASDIEFCQSYFRKEGRNPTVTELKLIDTYWSDHCRHTTFMTIIDDARFNDKNAQEAYNRYLEVRKEMRRTKPICLMDLATVAAKYLDSKGMLPDLDKSEEINACSVNIRIKVDGKDEDWLLMFKNETHNHPTEIEPFGGAATCIGGAIRDPLSGRAYVYSAMRVTGCADPTVPFSETLPGKLPQSKITTSAAAGYSSYGNQIGLATGLVDEIYHDGYKAKRMEIGAVVAAVPKENVKRLQPQPGDKIILLGGRTGRDGCGGATGSSKSHTVKSLAVCGAEVQKGNAPEERKLQRLFRNPEAAKLIKRCNDFGAGGVSVAVGELAEGLEINLDKVPKKYEGLDGTELAISESQERMAIAVAAADVDRFISLAETENLEATVIAEVKEEKRLKMYWQGDLIVDIAREFLDSFGAEKHIRVNIDEGHKVYRQVVGNNEENLKKLASDLNVCSKKGLVERFDSTIGAGTVLMPFGGKYQMTPPQAMVNKISVEKGVTDDCSLMAYGFNPYISEINQFAGAYIAVCESVGKLVATGAPYKDIYLTFQEYFEKLQHDERRWGKPMSALLGAFKAQLDLGVAAIGGKDSMSGTFENISVPPTLVSFAVAHTQADRIISPEFKRVGDKIYLLRCKTDATGMPEPESFKNNLRTVSELTEQKKISACYAVSYGGIAEALLKMSLGNGYSFRVYNGMTTRELFGYSYGAFVLESDEEIRGAEVIGEVTQEKEFILGNEKVGVKTVKDLYTERLEKIFPVKTAAKERMIPKLLYSAEPRSARFTVAAPRVLIPVFPGTNCEYDTAKAFEAAGAKAEIFVIKNLTKEAISESVEVFAEKIAESNIIFIPGGFSGGDEPDGSGKFITAFFRNSKISDAVSKLLYVSDGLMGGICNGFQALIKLGYVPYGKITAAEKDSPTLTFNDIGRHQSKIVRTRVVSNASPWFCMATPGDIYNVAISHGEGKFWASNDLISRLAANGQIATQYVDYEGNPSMNVEFNPNGSVFAIEGITSPDGRIFGKMGHCERVGSNLYKNVVGNYDIKLFESAVKYYK